MKCIFILLVLKASIHLCYSEVQLDLIKEWNEVDYDFPSEQDRKEAFDNGWFVPTKGFPLDVDVESNKNKADRIFVTIPRFSEGVPVTLGTIERSNDNTMITPYPDYSWHSTHGANCDKITSVLRITIDKCRRLWVMDTGKIGSVQKCPPQLLAFNLDTDELIIRYKFPKSQYTDLSLFISTVSKIFMTSLKYNNKKLHHFQLVDIEAPFSSCSKTKVYIPDVNAFALIVYDFRTGKSWRIQNKLFYPNPNFGTFTIAGESFDMMDGIFGITMKKENTYTRTDDRLMYFHSLSSITENTVPLSVINNRTLWENNSGAEPRAFEIIGARNSQTSIQTMDSHGNLWFVLVEPLALCCWDSSTPYDDKNIKMVVKNDKTLQFASGLKLVTNTSGKEELWITTIRIQVCTNFNFQY